MNLKKFFDTLGNMGIWIRFHDSRRDPPAEEGRVWGPVVEGFALSLAPLHGDSVSVLIKNTANVEKRASLPSWLRYVKLDITGPDGSPVGLKPYGNQVLETQPQNPAERIFPPEKYLSTEIPVSALYDLTTPGAYRVVATCPVPGQPASSLTSNEITLTLG